MKISHASATTQNSVGVVIRTKDRPFFVKRALASVAAQTHPNWQIMLVNDGGDVMALKETIASDIAALPKNRFTLLDLNPGQGRSAAFNRGVEALKTDFVTCLDDDDTWEPEFMSALVEFIGETSRSVPDLGGAGARVTALKEEIIETDGKSELRVIGQDKLPPAFFRGEFFLNPLAYACYRQDIYPVQWMMRREAVLEVGGFPEEFDVMEDRAFMNRFLVRWRVAILDSKLAYHHRRVQRATDNTRNVLLNTLDNPSYDWRLYADLARPTISYAESSKEAAIVRSIATDLMSEVNYETSAIWNKVDGEMKSLRAQIAEDKAELQRRLEALKDDLAQPVIVAAPAETPPEPKQTTPQRLPFERPAPDASVFDIWSVIPEEGQAHYVVPGQSFAERLQLSCKAEQYGLMMHASRAHEKLVLQMPQTQDWAALEINVAGLAPLHRGLRCRFSVETRNSYLFETAIMRRKNHNEGGDGHHMEAFEVHHCDAETGCLITRGIEADWLQAAIQPRVLIIFPRNADNFQFICTNLVLEPM